VDIQHRIENNILSWGRKGKKKEKRKAKKDYLVTESLIIHELPHFPQFRPIWALVAT
jgi:hypothetical protein